MSHEIDTVSIGRASYASTQREWHGLGELMLPGQSIEQWQAAAGMDYKVQKGFVRYATSADASPSSYRKVDDKIVLFRSDTGAPLGVVSDKYKVVQPAKVLEFFREWAQAGGLTIESAGVLFGGKRYFATAKLADGVSVASGDKLVPYALLSTSADGTLATECRWTTVRTVCNNTLSIARTGSACYKTTHRSIFNFAEAKATVEAAQAEFGAFMQAARMLAQCRLSAKQGELLTIGLFQKADQDSEVVKQSFGYQTVMELFEGAGKGSSLASAKGTAWGWLNAVTEFVDHHARTRGENAEENRTANALWGQGDALKAKAMGIVSGA